MRLTEEGQQHWVVVRHDKQVDAGEGGAGLEVSERVSQLTLLATAADKHLHQQQDHKDKRNHSTGEPVTTAGLFCILSTLRHFHNPESQGPSISSWS